MSSLISGVQPKTDLVPELKIIGGIGGVNRVAMRFWEALLSEVLACFPRAARAVFSGGVEGVMDPSRLDPCLLDEDAFYAPEKTFRDLFRDVILEAEFYGPPAPILCAIYDDGGAIAEGLPLETDCADAGLLPFLTGWLLAACGIPLNALRGSEFGGELRVHITESGEGREVTVPTALSIAEMSEGLHHWQLAVDLASCAGED